MARSDFRFLHRLRVRWSEVDLQGIVFNAQYLNYLEVATQEYFHHLGFSIYRIAALKMFDIVTANVTVQFQAPARLDDLLEIGIQLREFGNRSFTTYSELFRPAQRDPITIILARNVTIDPDTIRPVTVPQEFRALVEEFEATGQPPRLEQFPMICRARNHSHGQDSGGG